MAQRFKPAFPGEVPTLGHGVIDWMTDMLATPDRARRLADLQAIREPLYREVAQHLFDSSALSPDAAVAALAELLAIPEASRE